MTDLDYCHLAVVERSGSMHPIREASEEALRSMLAEQIELPGRLTVTLAQFDNVYEVVLQDCPAGAENDLKLSLYGSVLGSVWLHISGVIPERWQPGNYKSREIYLTLRNDSRRRPHLRYALWAKEHEWYRADPWWVHGVTIDFERVLFGRPAHEATVVDSGVCVVPMPERNYEATYEVTEHVDRWSRRLGRFRDPQVWHITEVEPGAPIPVPGKGENSWDLGDDSIHASSVAGRNVSDAIGKLVASALSTRERYGGQHMSVADAAGPLDGS